MLDCMEDTDLPHVSRPPRADANRVRSPATIIMLAGAALVLSACGETQQAPDGAPEKTGTPVDAQQVADAVRASVDEKAIEGAIKGAAAAAIREELGAIGSVIDEDALVSGIDKAVDGKAVTGTIERAARDSAHPAASPSAE